MDPLSTASAFATIVGLICNFKSERSLSDKTEYHDFVNWLEEKRHENIIDLVKANNQLSNGIQSFLREDNKLIMSKLNALGDIMSTLSARIEGLSEIAAAVNPGHEISDQCLRILRQLNESESSRFIEIKIRGQSLFQIMDGKGGNIDYEEPRFIEDDLLTLQELGMLRLDYGSKGSRIFYITRRAVEFLKYTK